MFYEDVFRALNKARVKYLVAGGIAVVLHGFTRFTADLNLIIHLEEKNIDRFFDALAKLGYKPRLPLTKKQFQSRDNRNDWARNRNMKVFSFFHPVDHLRTIDLFIKEPIKFGLMAKNAKGIKAGNITIPVVSIQHLIRLKQKAGRSEDLVDIANLKVIQKGKW